jgi:hypothetical protein
VRPNKKSGYLNIGRALDPLPLPDKPIDITAALDELRKAPRPVDIKELKRILSLIGVEDEQHPERLDVLTRRPSKD